ncbi:MAG: cysteine--tRNA ligase [Patescibacteria group bacterium]
MKIFSTLSQKKEEFQPLEDKKIGMYVCGPTVYDVGHLGHARSAVSFDVIRRYFEYKGFTVTFVSNITDVDDKMIKRAAEEKITEIQLAEKIIPEYAKDYAALGVKVPTHQPRATQYIQQMVTLIEDLLEKDVAYATEDGIYFEVSKFPGYGKLSGQNLQELRAGARIEVDEKKKNPEDFAVWKKEKPGEPSWKGPLGMPGRPGWHIECSAMSADILGETFDIHGGGIDLQFPHHEDEIAQSEMASDKPFALYWLHNGHIRVNKEKMSKSLGNFFTIKDILKKHNPLVVRYFLLSTHYRMPIDFTDSLLEQAKNGLERLRDAYANVKRAAEQKEHTEASDFDVAAALNLARSYFEAAMDDDFEISRALAALFELVNRVNVEVKNGTLNSKQAEQIMKFFDELDAVLGVITAPQSDVSSEIESLIAERNEARKKKNFKRSDELRKELEAKGIILEDTKEGTTWKRAL